MPAPKPLPPQEELKRLFRYEPDTGRLYWNHRPQSDFPTLRSYRTWNARFEGKEAFTAKTAAGYHIGAINQILYYAHRVIHKMLTGEDPPHIDHIDGDRGNNRQENLRAVPEVENHKNIKRRSNNTSGVTGVSWFERDKVWVARAQAQGTFLRSCHTSRAEAVAARNQMSSALGFHNNHGRD